MSLFCVLNVAVVLFSNQPQWFQAAGERLPAAAFGPRGVECAQYASWVLGRYAHLTGLGPRWALFGPLPQWDYHWVLEARRRDGPPVVLPRPPWRRGGWLDPLLEHRQSKFELNLLGGADLQVPLGRYLCRVTDAGGGERPTAIVFTLHRRPVLPRTEAEARGDYLDAPLPPAVTDVVDCTGATSDRGAP